MKDEKDQSECESRRAGKHPTSKWKHQIPNDSSEGLVLPRVARIGGGQGAAGELSSFPRDGLHNRRVMFRGIEQGCFARSYFLGIRLLGHLARNHSLDFGDHAID